MFSHRKDFWYCLALSLSIAFVIWCFNYADTMRGYEATGTEVFMIALPIYIVKRRCVQMGQKIKQLQEYNEALRKAIM